MQSEQQHTATIFYENKSAGKVNLKFEWTPTPVAVEPKEEKPKEEEVKES